MANVLWQSSADMKDEINKNRFAREDFWTCNLV